MLSAFVQNLRDLWAFLPKLIRFHAIGSIVGMAVAVTALALSLPRPLRLIGLTLWFCNGLVVWTWIDEAVKYHEKKLKSLSD